MKNSMNKIITIPNVLSFFRILLIPAILITYFTVENKWICAIFLIISAITDVLDGFIARKFNMISHVGRILDPVADKLTQISVMICLCFEYPLILMPVILLVVKEISSGIIALIMLRKTKNTINSDWHGKVATVTIYLTMFMHIIWRDIPYAVSVASIILCIVLILLSFVLYVIKYLKLIDLQNHITE